MRRTIRQLGKSGLRRVEYESEKLKYHTQRTDTAVKRNVMDSVRKVNQSVKDRVGEQFGADGVEITVHQYPAEDHAPVQGHQFNNREFQKMQDGLPFVDIQGRHYDGFKRPIGMWNCRHSAFPIIVGVSPQNYTDEQLEEILKNNEKGYTLPNGKRLTMYQCTQQQRKLETEIRYAKEGRNAAELAGNKELANEYQAKISRLVKEYQTFSKACGLKMQPKNIYVANSGESGIINERTQKAITPITDKAIEKVPNTQISGYTESQCAYIREQHKELLEYARDKNENKEVAFVFDGSLQNRRKFTGSDDKLDFGSALYGKDLFVMHNHPRNSSYSTTDLSFWGSNSSIKTLTIVKNNGKVETLTKGENFDLTTFTKEYNRLYKKIVKGNTNAEKDKFVRTLLTKSKSGVIWNEGQ